MSPYQHGEVFVTEDGGATVIEAARYLAEMPAPRNSQKTPAPW